VARHPTGSGTTPRSTDTNARPIDNRWRARLVADLGGLGVLELERRHALVRRRATGATTTLWDAPPTGRRCSPRAIARLLAPAAGSTGHMPRRKGSASDGRLGGEERGQHTTHRDGRIHTKMLSEAVCSSIGRSSSPCRSRAAAAVRAPQSPSECAAAAAAAAAVLASPAAACVGAGAAKMVATALR
jgi:hypothetical protein